jgi:hypothetical protein
LLAAYGLPNTLQLMPFYSWLRCAAYWRLDRRAAFGDSFVPGWLLQVAGMAMILAYLLPSASMDWFGIATLSGTPLVNGIASASIALLLAISAGAVPRPSHASAAA